MLPARSHLAHTAAGAAFVLVFLLALTACATTKRPPPRTPAPEVVPPPPEPKPAPAPSPEAPLPEVPPELPPARVIDPAAAPVVARLAKQLRISEDAINVAQVVQAEWPNACLGLAAEGEVCAQVITPGYAVSLIVRDQRFDFRTDKSGRRIRLAFAPLGETGEALVTWKDSASFAVLVIGTEGTTLGLRGGPRLVAPPPVPERTQELLQFVSHFAPFYARTLAGEITFRGIGTVRASPLEQRQIAEWTRLVSAESEAGLPGRFDDRAFVWRRVGGIAGFCDEVTVSRAGRAEAWPCRFPDAHPTAAVALTPEELEQLYEWLDTLAPFTWEDDGSITGTADTFLLRLQLDGQGTKPLSELDRERMLDFSNTLVRRLLVDGMTTGL